jgi:hypothetical protein
MVLSCEPGEGDGELGGPVAGRHEHVEGAPVGMIGHPSPAPSENGPGLILREIRISTLFLRAVGPRKSSVGRRKPR